MKFKRRKKVLSVDLFMQTQNAEETRASLSATIYVHGGFYIERKSQ